MRNTYLLLSGILLFLMVVFSEASEIPRNVCTDNRPFFEGGEAGWFWYRECREKKDEKKSVYKKIPRKIEIPWDEINELDPEEIAKIEENARKVAIMYPTTENIEEYRKLLTFISKKASEFTVADLLWRASSSEYEAQNPVKGSTYEVFRLNEYRYKKVAEIFRDYSTRAGLIIVFKDDCYFCAAQRNPVLEFQKKYNWDVKWVNMEENPVFAKNVGTVTVPDILLVLNRNGKPVIERVGSGLHTTSEIEDGIIYALYRLKERRVVEIEDIIFK